MFIRFFLLVIFMLISISPIFASIFSQGTDADLSLTRRTHSLFLERIPNVVAVSHILPELDYYDFCSLSLTSKACHNGMRVWWDKMKDLREQCRRHQCLDRFSTPLPNQTSFFIGNHEDEADKLLHSANRFRLPLIGIRIPVEYYERSFFYEIKMAIIAAANKERYGLKAPHIFYLYLSKEVSSKVRHLDLSYCGLKELPSCIGQLTALVSLDLRSNSLRDLPSSVRRLTKLKEVNLMMNNLTVVPNSICSRAMKLNLNDNNIKTAGPFRPGAEVWMNSSLVPTPLKVRGRPSNYKKASSEQGPIKTRTVRSKPVPNTANRTKIADQANVSASGKIIKTTSSGANKYNQTKKANAEPPTAARVVSRQNKKAGYKRPGAKQPDDKIKK